MSAGFTPGPLDLRVSQMPSANNSFHLYITDAEGRKIAALWGGSDEKMANGYLWSAAPELYYALVGLVNSWIKRGPFDEPLGASEQTAEMNAAVAALAKAVQP